MPEEPSDPVAVDRLFEAASELPPDEREAYLARHAPSQSVADEVRELLAYLDEGSGADEALVPAAPLLAARPERIGAYAIRDVLGSGGMGIVYLAEQERPQRRVAVKVLHGGVFRPEHVRRFEREAELLGRLQHSGIAQIFEAGTSGEGPSASLFLAMEYVEGTHVTEYADREDLGLRERVELVVELASAVEHAHQRGVMHRDLKPSNVLVSDAGQVKVIDFGVARPLDRDQDTLRTGEGQVVGTLAYMAPEQLAARPDDIDVRADVYALGVVAFELLSGALPIDLRGKSIADAARALGEEEPRKLGSIAPACRGDLEWIVARALEKEPERRYRSAGAFADDLRRYLNDEPVLARPTSAIYQLRKIARRNRAMAGGIAVAAVAILAALGVSVGFAIRNGQLAERERLARKDATDQAELNADLATKERIAREEATAQAEIAEQRAEDLELVVEFQTRGLMDLDSARMGATLVDELLRAHREVLGRAGVPDDEIERELDTLNATLRATNPTTVAQSVLDAEILERHRANIAPQFEDDPLLAAEMYYTLGDLHRELGMRTWAKELFATSLRIREEELGARAVPTIEARVALGQTHADLSELDEAERTLRLAESAAVEVGDVAPSLRWQVTQELGRLEARRGDMQAAHELFHRAYEGYRETLGDDAIETAFTLYLRGSARSDLRIDGAEEDLTAALDAMLAATEEDHANVLNIRGGLATHYGRSGRLTEAEAMHREILASQRRVCGDDHPATLSDMRTLAVCLLIQGRHPEAEPLLLELRERTERVYGRSHPETLGATMDASAAIVQQEKGREALPHARAGYALARTLCAEGDPRILTTARLLHDALWLIDRDEPDSDVSAELAELAAEIDRRMSPR